MSTFIPYINPIRLKPTWIEPNYDNIFPRFDIQTQREQYQRGVYPVNYYPDFLVDSTISLQVLDSSNVSSALIRNIETNTTVNITPQDITPSGWVSEKIFLIQKTPSQAGIYRIEITTAGEGVLYSDQFYVKSASDLKDLIQIQYSDSENRYGGGVFYSSTGQIWRPTVYFTGKKQKIISERDETSYNDERGERLLNVIATKSELVTLTDIHETYIDVIEEILKCDNIILNGQKWAAKDLTAEYIEDSNDIVDITFKITRENYNGFLDFNLIY